jgi:hypothetical protein
MESGFAVSLDPVRRDWPGSGPIDLDRHDRPHPSSAMEWWYANAHLTVTDGRAFSLFAAFFRVDDAPPEDAQRTDTHFLTWALVDVHGPRYLSESLLDPHTPEKALRELDEGRGPSDPRLVRALREVFAKGTVALPDMLMRAPGAVPGDRLALDFDGNRFSKRDDGTYVLELANRAGTVGCRLRFALAKPVVRHGDEGIVRGPGGSEMFYYFPLVQPAGLAAINGC